jgi:hypothetical protein
MLGMALLPASLTASCSPLDITEPFHSFVDVTTIVASSTTIERFSVDDSQ